MSFPNNRIKPIISEKNHFCDVNTLELKWHDKTALFLAFTTDKKKQKKQTNTTKSTEKHLISCRIPDQQSTSTCLLQSYCTHNSQGIDANIYSAIKHSLQHCKDRSKSWTHSCGPQNIVRDRCMVGEHIIPAFPLVLLFFLIFFTRLTAFAARWTTSLISLWCHLVKENPTYFQCF